MFEEKKTESEQVLECVSKNHEIIGTKNHYDEKLAQLNRALSDQVDMHRELHAKIADVCKMWESATLKFSDAPGMVDANTKFIEAMDRLEKLNSEFSVPETPEWKPSETWQE